jgi:hypothetical protein
MEEERLAQPPEAPRGAWIREEFGAIRAGAQWTLEHWVVVATLATALMYGSLRIAYSGFYAQLGLRPEDVGLGYAEILAQTVTGLVVISLAVIVSSAVIVPTFFAITRLYYRGCWFILKHLLRRLTGHVYMATPFETRAYRVPQVVLPIASWLVVAVLVVLAGSHRVEAIIVLGGLVIVEDAIQWRVFRARATQRHGLATAIAVITATLVGLGLLIAAAYDDGAAVQRGEPRHPVVLGITFASWGGNRAQVASDAPADIRALNKDKLMFLGQAGQTAILYDATTHDVIRLPAQSVTIIVKR